MSSTLSRAAITIAHQNGQIAAVIEMGMGQHNRIQVLSTPGSTVLFQSDECKGLTIIKLHGARFNTLSAVLPINQLLPWG